MKFENTRPIHYSMQVQKRLHDEVQIRTDKGDPAMFAVFHKREQVSEEFGPMNQNDVINFAQGYSKALKR